MRQRTRTDLWEPRVSNRPGPPGPINFEGQDWETVVLETNATFWRLIKKRRKQRTVSMSALRKRLRTK
ncbi:MAG: hypothetical protein V3S25_03185 [Nitrospirales bacterium]